jgi:hypothetical protein
MEVVATQIKRGPSGGCDSGTLLFPEISGKNDETTTGNDSGNPDLTLSELCSIRSQML